MGEFLTITSESSSIYSEGETTVFLWENTITHARDRKAYLLQCHGMELSFQLCHHNHQVINISHRFQCVQCLYYGFFKEKKTRVKAPRLDKPTNLSYPYFVQILSSSCPGPYLVYPLHALAVAAIMVFTILRTSSHCSFVSIMIPIVFLFNCHLETTVENLFLDLDSNPISSAPTLRHNCSHVRFKLHCICSYCL